MSINAGQITAEAVLDISQVDAATAKLTQNVQQVNRTLDSIKTPKLALDTTAVDAKAKTTSELLGTLFGKLNNVPLGKVGLDVGQAEQAAQTLARGLEGVAGKAGLSGTALVGFTAGLSATVAVAGAAAVALAQVGAEFRSIQRIIENSTIANGEALKALRADFDALFRSVPADGGDLAKAQAILFQEFRQTGEGARALVADLNAFTRVLGGDLAGNTRLVADVFNAWQVATEDQAQTLRDLANISKATGTPIGQLTAELTRNAVAAQALGLSIKETGVFLDALGDAGVQPRIVISALREAMNNLTKSGGASTEFLRDIIQSIKAAGDEAEASAIAAGVFTEAAGPTLARLIRSGRLELEEMVQEIENARDPLASGFAQGQTAVAQFQVALNNLKADLAPAGEAVLTYAATIGIGLVGAIKDAKKTIEDFMGSSAVKAFLELQQQGDQVSGRNAPNANPLGLPAGSAGQALASLAGQKPGSSSSFDAGDSIAQQAAATEHLTEANEQGVKAHNDLATAQANVAAASQKAKEEVKSLDDQLKAAGGDVALIQSLLTAQTQVKDFDAAITALTDRTLAANLIALRNQAEAVGNLTGDWSDYDAVVDDARAHMDAGRASQEAATTAQKEAAKAVADIEAAMAKAASAGVDLYAERLNNLANAVMPNLDEATTVSLKQALLLGDQQAALGIIAAATGQSQLELAAGLHASGAAAADAAKEAAAAAKGFEGFLTDELKSRWSSALGTLASGTDAATAAQAKLLEQAGHADQALELLLQHAGASPSALAALKRGLEEGGAAAFAAREAIQALATFARDQAGNIRLKVDVDIENAERALGKLQSDFREANAKRAEAESTATREFSEQQSQVGQQRSQLSADFQAQLKGIEQARSDSSAQLGRDIQSAVSTQNDALAKISTAREDAAAAFAKTMEDADDKLTLSLSDAATKFGESVRDLAEKGAEAVQTAAAAQAAALRSLSQAMASFNQQQIQNAFTASVALQNAEQQRLQDTGVFGGATNAERIAEIQRQGAAGLAQVEQQRQLANATADAQKQLVDAQKAQQKAVEDNTKALEKAVAAYLKSNRDAANTFGKAQRDAIDKLDKSNRDTAKQEADANEKARDAQREAQRQDRERQKALDDKAAEETRKFLEEVSKTGFERANDPERKGRTKAEQDFDTQEKARREEQRKADKAFQEEGDRIRREIENNKLLKQIAGKLDRPNVAIGPSTIQETSKDMLIKAREVASARLRV